MLDRKAQKEKNDDQSANEKVLISNSKEDAAQVLKRTSSRLRKDTKNEPVYCPTKKLSTF